MHVTKRLALRNKLEGFLLIDLPNVITRKVMPVFWQAAACGLFFRL
jgi:hypothetical protein